VEMTIVKDLATNLLNGIMVLKGINIGTIKEQSMRMADGIVLKECLDLIGGISRDNEGALLGISDSVWRILCANRNADGDPAPAVTYRMAMLRVLKSSSGRTGIDTEELLKTDLVKEVKGFLQTVRDVVWNRRTFRGVGSNGNILGLSPQNAREGDSICILHGCSVAAVMRMHGDGPTQYWQLIGDAYVDEMMDGETLCGEDVKAENVEEFLIR
jgi:hypothetical protein